MAVRVIDLGEPPENAKQSALKFVPGIQNLANLSGVSLYRRAVASPSLTGYSIAALRDTLPPMKDQGSKDDQYSDEETERVEPTGWR